MKKIPFSVVSTCRNEINSIKRWKQNMIEQTRKPDEVVIVDAFSDDGTFEVLSDWAKNDKSIKIIQKKGNPAFGRNLAIRNTTYEHILTTDLGVRLSKNWCEELILPFEKDSSVEVVAGNTCIDLETVTNAFGRAEYYIEHGGFQDLEEGYIIGNRSSAYLKSVWKKLGGLPEDLTFCADDSVFGRQIIEKNYKMAFAPKAMTYWGRPDNAKLLWKEQFNYGRGGGEANIKKPFFFKIYAQGKIPWFMAIFGNSLWNIKKQSKLSSFKQAIEKKDYKAFFLIPVLAFGNGWHRMKGYKVGYERGEKHCISCRNRLKNEW
jgi:cellulose synthase/poly-beta-1,6-N-acetylglucosamine synthase-like glycosyltransferase